MKELLPVNQNVVLDITDSGEQKTAAGIIIPETAKEMSMFAKLVWMSSIENAEVKPGDVVVFKPHGGTVIEFEEKMYLIMPYADILAKVIETEQI